MESMEVDEMQTGESTTKPPPPVNKNALFVMHVLKKGGLKKSKMPVESFEGLTVKALMSAVSQEINRWEWTDDKLKPTNFDILHRSRPVVTDEDVKKIGPLSVVTVVAKIEASHEDHKSQKFIEEYTKNRNTFSQLTSCSMAIRTAFLNSKFITMIENLGNSEMLENMFAMVPELRNDPVAIGIIQDPSLIYHLSDPESIKKLAKTRPWVIEAFNFISASIHQERGGPPQGIPNHLFNAAMLDDGEDEDMEDSDDESPGSSRGDVSSARITREQLAQALNALGGGGPGAAAGLSRGNAFGGLFQPPPSSAPPVQQPRGTPASSNSGVGQAGANIQNLMNTLAGTGGGMPGQPLSSEVVARAVTEALRRLTPEQRADQLNAIRNFATQFSGGPGGGGSSAAAAPSQPAQQPPQQTPAAAPSAPASGQSSSSLSQQYQSQLKQMREMGITDERLSILALRVSEGDVNTAVELIFSGWQGEGADLGN